MVKVAITGVSGRMGQMLVQTVGASHGCSVIGGVEREGHAWLGQDLGIAQGGAEMGVPVVADLAELLDEADAVIDFTAPVATLGFASQIAGTGVSHIIGTTGFSNDELSALDALADQIPMVRAGNMSLGVNLLVQLTRQVARSLDADFDVEVVEAHHRHKVDAPSGTALMLGEAAAEGRGVSLDDVRDSGRDGITGARKRGDIGFHAIRGGDVVGEHDVIFAADGERIVLRHIASDRGNFARGAVKAARWAHGKPNGLYSMIDVLGL